MHKSTKAQTKEAIINKSADRKNVGSDPQTRIFRYRIQNKHIQILKI